MSYFSLKVPILLTFVVIFRSIVTALVVLGNIFLY